MSLTSKKFIAPRMTELDFFQSTFKDFKLFFWEVSRFKKAMEHIDNILGRLVKIFSEIFAPFESNDFFSNEKERIHYFFYEFVIPLQEFSSICLDLHENIEKLSSFQWRYTYGVARERIYKMVHYKKVFIFHKEKFSDALNDRETEFSELRKEIYDIIDCFEKLRSRELTIDETFTSTCNKIQTIYSSDVWPLQLQDCLFCWKKDISLALENYLLYLRFLLPAAIDSEANLMEEVTAKLVFALWCIPDAIRFEYFRRMRAYKEEFLLCEAKFYAMVNSIE